MHAAGAADYDVVQHDDRNLWDELESAYRWWPACGRPGRDRYDLTVTPDHSRIWLDHTGRLIACWPIRQLQYRTIVVFRIALAGGTVSASVR
ncbi:hypothetical protein ACRB68_55410 [Actinomadura sp. RB68]|uniref:Uncharacterized protein n=1 Tax=Actinomadura macrotermitis TaxID=2585200 RepID=A0A7K0C1U8_9ACTN|nr:hypothetical protein [Actinomadura macrotermitis]